MPSETFAKWVGNDLMVYWYGSTTADHAATLYPRYGKFHLVFWGIDETFRKVYDVKPSAMVALMDINNWQCEVY